MKYYGKVEFHHSEKKRSQQFLNRHNQGDF